MALSPSSASVYNGQQVSFSASPVSGAVSYTWSYGSQTHVSHTNNSLILQVVNVTTNNVDVTISRYARDEFNSVIQTDSATLTTLTVPATGMSVSPTSMSLSYTNQYGYMTGTPTTNISGAQVSSPGVNYASADTSICLVNSSSGMLNAEGNGTVNVWVGCNSYPGISGYCTVTVTGFPIPVTGVNVTPSTTTITQGSGTQLSRTITPSNGTIESESWTTSDSGVAQVNGSGYVTGISAGTARITCTINGVVSDYCDVTVSSSRPVNWAWSYSMVSGGAMYNTVNNAGGITAYIMPATEWNSFTTRINEFRTYKNLSQYGFTSVGSGTVFTPTIYNQASTAIGAMASGSPTAYSGYDVSAYMMNQIVSVLNSIT